MGQAATWTGPDPRERLVKRRRCGKRRMGSNPRTLPCAGGEKRKARSHRCHIRCHDGEGECGRTETRDKRLHPVAGGTSARHKRAEDKVEDRGKVPGRAGNLQYLQGLTGPQFRSNNNQDLTILRGRMAVKEATGEAGSSAWAGGGQRGAVLPEGATASLMPAVRNLKVDSLARLGTFSGWKVRWRDRVWLCISSKKPGIGVT